jgi:hypothetical protein
MKKRLLIALLFAFFIVNGAIAGSVSLVGDWEGKARAILPDGTIIENIVFEATIDGVDGGLFSGVFVFTLPPSAGGDEITADFTGYIKGRSIQGVISSEESPSALVGSGLFNANLKKKKKKKMVGIVRDLIDGSTTYFSAKKVRNGDEGDEGCSQGYWKTHRDSWTGYETDDLYEDVFGVSYDKTLLEALWSGGGGEYALGRQAVAALLNAAHPHVDYYFTEDEVIEIVQDAYANGNFEDAKDHLERHNDRSNCPLN